MKLYCHRCEKDVDIIEKLWYIICSECRIILKERENIKLDCNIKEREKH